MRREAATQASHRRRAGGRRRTHLSVGAAGGGSARAAATAEEQQRAADRSGRAGDEGSGSDRLAPGLTCPLLSHVERVIEVAAQRRERALQRSALARDVGADRRGRALR